ncbi:MAG: hypothetical protein NZ899_06370 [Thermoguttaceae bacterium]|nr:hypothetical protein [Thermoguttaceae bacterium]MDW8079215.1 Calx-beta domain-containing protein [Thermoguttaceae bacterium]
MRLGTAVFFMWTALVVPAVVLFATIGLAAAIVLELSQLPEVKFAVETMEVQEGKLNLFLPLKIVRQRPILGIASRMTPPLILELESIEKTAQEGKDFRLVKESRVDGQESEPGIKVEIINNPTVDSLRIFEVRIAQIKGGRLGASNRVTVHLKDDDKVGLRAEVPPCIEVRGQTVFTLPMSLTAPCSFETRLVFKSRDGDALAGRHYEPVAGEVVLAPGQQRWPIELRLIEGSFIQGSKQFFLDVSLYRESSKLASAEIPVSLCFPGKSLALEISPVTWRVSSETKEVIVPIRLAQVGTEPITLFLKTEDGSAQAGKHFQAVEKEITFEPGQMEKRLTIPLLPTSAEGSKLSFAVVAYPSHQDTEVIARGQVTLVYVTSPPILTAPERIALAVRSGQQEAVKINVTLTRAADEPASFEYRTVLDPGQPPIFDMVQGTVVIPAGQTTAELQPIMVRGLRPGSPPVDVRVVFENPVNVRLGTNEVVVTVRSPKGLRGTSLIVVPLTASAEQKWQDLQSQLAQIIQHRGSRLVDQAIWFVDLEGQIVGWTGGELPKGATIVDEEFDRAFGNAFEAARTVAGACEESLEEVVVIWVSELNPDFGDLGRQVRAPMDLPIWAVWVRDEVPGGRMPSSRLRGWFSNKKVLQIPVDDLAKSLSGS